MTNIDRGIMTPNRQLARQNQVPVQNAANRIADRLVEIVALHEHGEKCGYGTLLEMTRTFEYLRQQRKHGWRVSFLTRRLARRQADFPLRHGQPRYGIENQQDVFALIAEVFGDGERDESRADSKRRRPV